MILYLDASALVKRYVEEQGTPEVARAIRTAGIVGTSIITRAEIAAAFSKAVRVGALHPDGANLARAKFHRDWPSLIRIQTTEALIAYADELAWDLGLRAYDAVQLASASLWRDTLEEEVALATFDRRLWEAAAHQGLLPLPAELTAALRGPQEG